MKSKLLLTLLAPLMVGFVSGCNGTSGMKLTYGTYITTEDKTITDARIIEYGDLIEKMDSTSDYGTENFILVVAPTNGCLCWEKFKPVLKEYIKDTHYLVYQMSITDFSSNAPTYGIAMKQGSVALTIVKATKIVKSYVASSIFDSVTSLKSEIDKYVRAPELYYVDQAYLDNAIKTGETVLVDYVRCNCSDCNYATPKALWTTAYQHTFKTKMLMMDVQELRDGNPDDYQEFKDVHYLSNKFSKEFGYGTGVVPTIHYYERGTLKDATVFFNDTVELVDGVFKVTESFYSSERQTSIKYSKGVATPILEGLTLDARDINEINSNGQTHYTWTKESAFKYHKPLFDAFMNMYVL